MIDSINKNDDQHSDRETSDKSKKHFQTYYKVSEKLFFGFVSSFNKDFLAKNQTGLNKANMYIMAEEYLAGCLFASLIDVIFFLGVFLSGIAFHLAFWIELILLILIPSTGLLTYYSCIKYPAYKAAQREKLIDINLGSAMAFISAMAGADVSVNVIFRELSERKEYDEVAREAMKVTRNTDLLGMDILTAIYEASKTSPSINWQKFLQGAVTTATAGGRLKPYFIGRASEYQSQTRIALRKNADDVALFAETYVTVGVAFPLFLIVILAVMGVITHPASSSVLYFLIVFSFVVVPIIIGMFIWILSSIGREVSYL